MYVIGERINGMFKDVRQAIGARDAAVIKDLAARQMAAGADALDVNVGPAAADPKDAMEWLITTIREVSDAPLAIDTTKPEVMALGLKLAGRGAILNSTTGDPAKLATFLPLAAEHQASVISLTIDEKGIPRDGPARIEVAFRIVAAAMEAGIPTDKILIDPVILPVKHTQPTAGHVLEALKDIRLLADPAPKTVLGLSNVSQGSIYRPLVNRTYLVMALTSGLDAAILDPMDTELMDAAITAELLLNKCVYCDDFLKASRS